MLDETDSSWDESFFYKKDSFIKDAKMSSLPSKVDLRLSQGVLEISKFQNYRMFIDQVKSNFRKSKKMNFLSISSSLDESSESNRHIRHIQILGAASRDKVTMPFQKILD